MKTFKQVTNKVEFVLNLAREGKLGTPDKPNRGSSGKVHFWNAYNGIKSKHEPKKGMMGWEYAEAGKRFRKENEKL